MHNPLIIKGLDSGKQTRVTIGASLILLAVVAGVNFLVLDDDEKTPVMPPLDMRLAALEAPSAPDPDPVAGTAVVLPHAVVVRTVSIKLRSGETPAAALTAAGVDPVSAGLALNALGSRVDMRSLKPGQRFIADVNADGRVVNLRYPLNAVDYFESSAAEDGFVTTRKEVPTDKEVIESACRLGGSLYESFKACGLDRELVPVVVGLLESQFDLMTEIRKGDILRIVVQKESVNGSFLRYGRVEGLLYDGKVATAAVFMHEEEDGRVSYWDADGNSIERPFIRTPVRYNGFTAGYGLRRLHPILNAYTPGRAVDYAAPKGTPVLAVGDGRVIFSGRKGAHGNMVVLKHANGIQTYYANLESIRKGVTRGAIIDQGFQIGTVGSGTAKFPFLHFAVARDGKFVHPAVLSEAPGPSMAEPAKYDFLAYVGRMTGRLRALPIRGTELVP